MGLIKEFFANRVLFAAVLGWLCAQVLKLIITACMTKKVNVERLWGAGGMPSAHSAMVCALTISVARFYGVSDPLFALAVMFAFVTMYDAMGVRREAGEHARLLNKYLNQIRRKTPMWTATVFPIRKSPKSISRNLSGTRLWRFWAGCCWGS